MTAKQTLPEAQYGHVQDAAQALNAVNVLDVVSVPYTKSV